MSALVAALGGMRAIPQWFVWKLTWNEAEGKYKKVPWSTAGNEVNSGNPLNWQTFEQAHARWKMLGDGYALGFRLTRDCGYFMLDIDDCITDGAYSAIALDLVGRFPGAMVELTSSRKGLHVIGRTVAGYPEHGKRNTQLDLEFYTDERGIAFGLDDVAQGNADSTHDAAVMRVVGEFFPYVELIEGARPEWRGPADDDVLISRMLQAKDGVGAAMGAKVGLRALWNGEVEKNSDNDGALAMFLAFWTGCDVPRMVRLMKRSGMKREKWSEHRTYLDITCRTAATKQTTVYQEPERNLAVVGEMLAPATGVDQYLHLMSPDAGGAAVTHVRGDVVSVETMKRVDELLVRIGEVGDMPTLYNEVMQEVQESGIPLALGESLVSAFNKKLDLFGAKLPVAKLRAMLFPPRVMGSSGDAPLWVQKHCYVKERDMFLDMENAFELTPQSFNAEYARLMPVKQNGNRENAAEWALQRWGMRTVHRKGYRPDKDVYFSWDGLEYANTYSPLSLPATAEAWTEQGVRGIELFKQHLYALCDGRDEVYSQLLMWLAHNVQKPGVKIRWSPLLKGAQRDGKSIVFAVLRAAMGNRNVSVTGNAVLTASGGFNDWAFAAAVNVIEEIWLTGKLRHSLYNSMKEAITNDVMSINPKGRTAYTTWNITNHAATSNHSDAIPIESDDERWMIIFTPWGTLSEAAQYRGMTGEGLQQQFDELDAAYKNCAGEFRAWFLSIDCSALSRKAPMTDEKARMFATSRDDGESVAAQIIQEGGYGITSLAFSSSCLSSLLKMKSLTDNFDLPRTNALNYMLTRLGYTQLDRVMKWDGRTHRIWTKNGTKMTTDQIRSVLDGSRVTDSTPSL